MSYENKTLNSIDWNLVLDVIVSNATSAVGKEALEKLSLCKSPDEATQSQREILESQNILATGIRPFMESLDLISIWLQRLKKEATLTPLEFKDVRHFLSETLALKESLETSHSLFLNEQGQLLFQASEALSAIDQIMSPDGSIRVDASEVLYNLYQEKNQKAREVSQTLDRLVKEQDLEHVLQDRFVTTREGRWVLPIKNGMQGKFDGIIHASSQSQQTVFMEPKEVLKSNNRLREIELEIENEIQRLLKSLSEYLYLQLADIEVAKNILLQFDILFAKAQFSMATKSNFVEFKNTIHIKNIQHPLLVLDPHTEVTANSVEYEDGQNILLLSGPNAGGKTVLLKAIGLAAQMARCGLPICADENSTLPFFKIIHVGVGDAQSVDSHLSTFAAHLKILDEASQSTGPETLVLVDEICGSTDPEEGSALARAFIERFCEQKVFGVITSHLSPLKLGWKSDSGVINGSLEYDSQNGRPTYKYLNGVPGQSLAIQTAKRVGVAEKIVGKALSFLSPDRQRYEKALEQIEELKEQLSQRQEELRIKNQEANKKKSKYESLILKFEKEKEALLSNVVTQAEKKIDKLVEHSKVDELFKKHSGAMGMKRQLPEIVKAKSAKERQQLGPKTMEEFKKLFPAGSKVYAETLGKDAVVQGPPNGKGLVPVLAQSMRVTLHWESLLPPRNFTNPTGKILKNTQAPAVAPIDTNLVIDLRGLKVEEALNQLDRDLDRVAMHQQDRVKVVHGHGTDSLKKAVRSFLSRSLYVKKWNAGSSEQGGDGITWVEITD